MSSVLIKNKYIQASSFISWLSNKAQINWGPKSQKYALR
jgi:hypothetical protein